MLAAGVVVSCGFLGSSGLRGLVQYTFLCWFLICWRFGFALVCGLMVSGFLDLVVWYIFWCFGFRLVGVVWLCGWLYLVVCGFCEFDCVGYLLVLISGVAWRVCLGLFGLVFWGLLSFRVCVGCIIYLLVVTLVGVLIALRGGLYGCWLPGFLFLWCGAMVMMWVLTVWFGFVTMGFGVAVICVLSWVVSLSLWVDLVLVLLGMLCFGAGALMVGLGFAVMQNLSLRLRFEGLLV